MKNNYFVSVMLATVLAFGLVLVSCSDKKSVPPSLTASEGQDIKPQENQDNSASPVFTLTNIDLAKQGEGSTWFVFGLFPTGTSAANVLADVKLHKSQANQPSYVMAYAGGDSRTLPWQGIPGSGPISISSKLTATAGGDWKGSGSYDGWVLVYNGSVWNGYKLAIIVQGNVSKDASMFVKEITNQS
jgi:hypothetical protein